MWPPSLTVIDKGLERCGRLIAKDEHTAAEGVFSEHLTADPAQAIDAFPEVLRLYRHQDSHLRRNLDHDFRLKKPRIRIGRQALTLEGHLHRGARSIAELYHARRRYSQCRDLYKACGGWLPLLHLRLMRRGGVASLQLRVVEAQGPRHRINGMHLAQIHCGRP